MNDTGFYETEKGESEQRIPSATSEPEWGTPLTREESPAEMKIRLKNCEKRYEELKFENERLHNRIVDLTTELEQERGDIRRLQGELDSARIETTRLQSERDSWQQKFEECREIAENLREQVTELRDKIRTLEEEMQKLQNEIKTLEECKDVFKRDNENLEKFLKSQMEKYECMVQEYRGRAGELERILEERGRSLIECQQELSICEREKRELKQKIQSYEETIEIIRKVLRNLQGFSDDIPRILEILGPERPVQPGVYEEPPAPQPEISLEPRPSEPEEKPPWEQDSDEDVLLEL